jgi:hypothetical protein
MAEEKLSPETQAIVDRLVREGELLRNKGDHSIKSVKETLLNKFAPVLDQISINTTQTAKSLGVMETYFTGNTEKLDTLGEEIAKMNAGEKKALEEKLKKEREDAIKKKENDRENMIGFGNISKNLKSGFEGLKSGFKALKEDPLGSLMNIGKWALILPLVAGAAKGLLDSIFGEDSVITFFKDIYDSPFMKFVREHPWASLGTALTAMAAVNWAQMYLTMMAAARTMGVRNVPTVAPVGTPGKPGGPAGPPAPRGTGLKNSIRNFLKMGRGKGLYVTLAASGALMLLGGEDDGIDMEAELNDINRDLNKEEQKAKDEMLTNFENERRGLGTIITNTLGGAAVGGATGAVFGGVGALPGALFGAIGGLFTGIAEVAWDAVDDYRNDIDELPNELEELLKQEQQDMFNVNRRGKRTRKSDETIAANAATVDGKIETIITGLREQIYGKDGAGGIVDELSEMEKVLADGPESIKTSGNRKVKGYVFNGKSYTEREFNALVEDQKKERVLREKQLAASERMLELRRGEAETIEKLNESEENLAEVNKDTADKKAAGTDIEPETTDRDRKQTVAAGGFALNIVNNYYNKGGDTVVSNQSDNRVSSNKSTGVVMAGPGGPSAFSSSLPNGAPA